MKRAGFTMIELIFVIVILGILAAVALPKFVGVAAQAQVGKVSAYVGTLNRTVGPALWAMSLSNKDNGTIKVSTVAGVNYDNEILAQIQTPEDVGDLALPAPEALDDPTVSSCTVYAPLPAGQTVWTDPEIAAWAMVSDVTIDGHLYEVVCMDGSATESPRFALIKDGAIVVTK